jgi:hypothetical protein
MVCARCGKPICEECIAPGSSSCMDCSIQATGDQIDAASRLTDRTAPEPSARRAKPSRERRAVVVAVVLGLVVIAAEVAVIRFLPITPTDARSPLSSEEAGQAADTAAVVMVQQAIERHREEHGRPPENLDVIMPTLPDAVAERLGEQLEYQRQEDGTYDLINSTESERPLAVSTRSEVSGVTP